MGILIRVFILFFFIYLNISLLEAKVITDIQKVNERNNNIILKDKERREFEENKKEKTFNNIKVKSHEIIKDKKSDANCFEINQILFFDNEVLKEKDFEKITSFYTNQCLTQVDISNILKIVNNIYINNGYITSQAYLKEQDLTKDVLKINILEGRIDNITMNQEEATEIVTAFPNFQENVLNLRDIEMGLDQINRLAMNKATLKLKASNKEGYTNIDIINEEDKFFSSQASINSNGIDSTGKGVGSLRLYLDNLLGYNTQLSLSLNGSLQQTNEKKSRGYGASWSIPYGYFLFKTAYSTFLYRSTIKGQERDYISSGESINYNTNIDYTLFRDTNTIIKTTFELSVNQNLNFIANELIQTSSIKLTVGRLGFDILYNQGNNQYNFSGLIHKGLPYFDPIKNGDDPYKKAQFLKYTAYLSANINFTLNDIPLNLTSSVSAQYSEDKLYSQELISMGGFYSVRGFNYINYYGEIGSYTHNDLTYQTRVPFFSKHIVLSPYIGLDTGVVEYDEDIFKHMIGAGIGFKAYYDNLSISFDFGIPLYAYDAISEEEYSSSFSIDYRY